MGSARIEAIGKHANLGAFYRAVLEDLRALDEMIESGLIESGVHRIGAEQELFLVDQHGLPAPVAVEVLEQLSRGSFTHEVGLFNVETNLQPRLLGEHCFSEMEQELRRLLRQVSRAAAPFGASVVMTGILPSLRRADLVLANMAPLTRYRALNEATLHAARGEVRVAIHGPDSLELHVDSMMLESGMTSFQVHLQVSAEEFARYYNCAQVALGPLLAAAANSPLLLGRRLWHESRIALFEAAAAFRTPAQQRRGAPTRASFGTSWVNESVTELFHEDLARHPVLLVPDEQEASLEILRAGGIPQLRALTTHCGTIWRWNRPCYGLNEDGRPHLRIENRVIPAGPSVPDQLANAALWLGLVVGLSRAFPDIRTEIPFEDARANFKEAARNGLGASLRWLQGKRVEASRLLVDQLIPLAQEGLQEAGVDRDEASRYLRLIEARIRSGTTGARWLLEAFESQPATASPGLRACRVTQALLEQGRQEEPVHTWAKPELGEGNPDGEEGWWLPRSVGELMDEDVITVPLDAPVELVASVMRRKGGLPVPVEDEQGCVVGALSRTAMLEWLGHESAAGGIGGIPDFLDPDYPCVPADTGVLEAAEHLLSTGADALLVVQADRHLLGLVTERRLLQVTAALLQQRSAAQPTTSLPLKLIQEEDASVPLRGSQLGH